MLGEGYLRRTVAHARLGIYVWSTGSSGVMMARPILRRSVTGPYLIDRSDRPNARDVRFHNL